ncbi:MAG: response regulator transcription factor [Gammaproteobacteria bacterium]
MKILIVDDHALVRDGLAHLLRSLADGDAAEVLEAATASDALAWAAATPDLDLALIDLNLPDRPGGELLDELVARFPLLPTVVLSASEDAAHVERVLAAGAMGFVPKSAPTTVLIQALRLVLAGGIYVPPMLARPTPAPPPVCAGRALTARQLAILTRIVEGASNKTIGRELGISEATVKAHVSAVFRTLGVSNRTQAARAARDLGIGE